MASLVDQPQGVALGCILAPPWGYGADDLVGRRTQVARPLSNKRPVGLVSLSRETIPERSSVPGGHAASGVKDCAAHSSQAQGGRRRRAENKGPRLENRTPPTTDEASRKKLRLNRPMRLRTHTLRLRTQPGRPGRPFCHPHARPRRQCCAPAQRALGSSHAPWGAAAAPPVIRPRSGVVHPCPRAIPSRPRFLDHALGRSARALPLLTTPRAGPLGPPHFPRRPGAERLRPRLPAPERSP